jgi:hypothetical protein
MTRAGASRGEPASGWLNSSFLVISMLIDLRCCVSSRFVEPASLSVSSCPSSGDDETQPLAYAITSPSCGLSQRIVGAGPIVCKWPVVAGRQ